MRAILLGGSFVVFTAVGIAGCGSDPSGAQPAVDAGVDGADADAGPACAPGRAFCGGTCIDVTEDDAHCGGCTNACTGANHCAAGKCQASKIEHVVLIVQENHTFDAYFGKWCKAPAGSNPTCTSGPSCCEAAPAKEPGGAAPVTLTDDLNFAADHDHTKACEVQQIDGGKMDHFVTGSTGADICLGSGPSCANPANFALADVLTVGAYWTLAQDNALADRWFQPTAGGSASNDMYFAMAGWQFYDNDLLPKAIGTPKGCLQGFCYGSSTIATFTGRTTIADLLLAAGKTFTMYADGYAHAKSQAPSCESIPSDCPYSPIIHPIAAQACKYDASDYPFNYYSQFVDGPNIKDWNELQKDLAANALPSFAFVKGRSFRDEHPNVSKISDGIAFVQATLAAIAGSSAAPTTLVILTWDEGGGFFDHVAPPPSIDVDDAAKPVPYGTRVPMIAIGPFVRKGVVSHVTMEHSSIVRFLEYNFLGPTGQLNHSDAKVANIGSLLDPSATGIHVPEN